MKKLLLLLALVLAFTFTALAQGTSESQGTTGGTSTTTTTTTKTHHHKGAAAAEPGAASTSKTAAKESTLTGCLAKSPEGNGYTLTNGRYKKGVDVTSSEDLSAHIGHEVKLTGNWEKPTAGEAGGAGPKGKTMRTFTATKLTHVADTCPAGGAVAHAKKGAKSTTTTESTTTTK